MANGIDYGLAESIVKKFATTGYKGFTKISEDTTNGTITYRFTFTTTSGDAYQDVTLASGKDGKYISNLNFDSNDYLSITYSDGTIQATTITKASLKGDSSSGGSTTISGTIGDLVTIGTGNSPTDSGLKISTDGTMTSNLDTNVPSEKASKTYSDTKIPKVASPVANDIAILNLDGSISDSGKKISDLVLQTEKGVVSGIATLDSTGKVSISQMPFTTSKTQEVANQAARLLLTTSTNFMIALQADTETIWGINANLDPSVSANWANMGSYASSVLSINGLTGTITGIVDLTTTQTLTNKAISSSTNKFGIISPTTNSTSAIQITKADGTTAIVTVDTTNNKLIMNNLLNLNNVTTTQRLALTGLSSGDIVFDTTINAVMCYDGTYWIQM